MTAAASPTIQHGGRPLNHRPRLVGIDVDHTLLRSDFTLAQETIEAVQVARDAGIEVALASSRPPRGLWPYLKTLGLTTPSLFVSFQGALVGTFDLEGTLEVHATSPLSIQDAIAAVAAARSLSLTTNWYTEEGWFVDALTQEIQREAQVVQMDPVLVPNLSVLSPPMKVLFIADRPEQISRLAQTLPSSITAETSHPTYLEVTAQGVDKATGMAIIAHTHGTHGLSSTAAIGDGRNDLGLFRRAGVAIAPANAHPTVLAEADYVTASNDENGVAIALRWLANLPRKQPE